MISDGGKILLGFNVTFLVLCAIILGCRYWAAKVLRRPIYFDDFVIPFAYVNALIFGALILWAVPNGIGAHMNEISPHELVILQKVFASATMPWLFSTVSVKVSVLWLYLRIFTTRRFKYCAWAVLTLTTVYLVVFAPVLLTNCIPFHQPWRPIPSGHCRNPATIMLVSVCFNMVIDVLIVILPMPWLWNLQMKTRKKVEITLMFCVGFATVAMMLWRIQMTLDSFTTIDFSYSLTKVALISELEVWFGFIAANMPNVAPVATRRVKSTASTIYKSVRTWNRETFNHTRGTRVDDMTEHQTTAKPERHGSKSTNSTQRQFSITVGANSRAGSSTPSLDREKSGNAIFVNRDFSVETSSTPASDSSTRYPW